MTTTRGGVGARPAGEPVGYTTLGGTVARPAQDDEARRPADALAAPEATPAPTERERAP